MGKLLYGPQEREVEVDDRALAHLKIVILSKLRRGESFAFSWENDDEGSDGSNTLWFHPSIPLEFRFYGGRRPSLNRTWIQALASTAERGDLTLLPEPDDPHPESQTNHARW